MISNRMNRRAALIAVFMTLLVCPTRAQDWKPLDPSQLALKAPVVEKDADAEALFWEVRVRDSADGGTPAIYLEHYLRVKLFNERGRESQSKIILPYGDDINIRNISARTIQPDGSVILLKKEEIFEQEIAKVGRLKIKAKSFAFPGVTLGSILEYRYEEIRRNQLANYLALQFQRDIPVQLVTYWIKPLSGIPYQMQHLTFNGTNTPFAPEKSGYYSTSIRNMPAFREEPYMPPEAEVRTWMLVYYSEVQSSPAAEYWRNFSKEIFSGFKSKLQSKPELKEAARKIAEAGSIPQQLERLYYYCLKDIRNISDDASTLTDADRQKLKENKNPQDTYRQKSGTGADINYLFAALAGSLGLDARVAMLSDRSKFFFNREFPHSYFMSGFCIAVHADGQWLFADPGTGSLPFGMLRWQEEGIDALISSPKELLFAQTPLSPPEKSQIRRVADLSLSEDGLLEGQIVVEYTGHPGADRRETFDADSPSQREETLRSEVKERINAAEIAEIRFENVADPLQPLRIAYRLKAAGYAQRTGKRMFIQPSFFQLGVPPRFGPGPRRHPIYFRYPWSEVDQVSIRLPQGYAPDPISSPSAYEPGKMMRHDCVYEISSDRNTLVLKRRLDIGRDGRIYSEAGGYPTIRRAFETIHERDAVTVSLRQAGEPAVQQSPGPR